jgi:hypothetical protein
MREGITVEVSAADRARLEAIVADRNSPPKHLWRARMVLLTADGLGTGEIMRRAGTSKVTVWRWQERFMRAVVAGLLRDKTVFAHPAAASQRARAHSGSDPRRSAGRGRALDGRHDVEGGPHQRQFGAAHLAGTWTAAPRHHGHQRYTAPDARLVGIRARWRHTIYVSGVNLTFSNLGAITTARGNLSGRG